jgi:hypothetical protein
MPSLKWSVGFIRIIKRGRLLGLLAVVLCACTCLSLAVAPAGADEPYGEWPQQTYGRREFEWPASANVPRELQVSFDELHRQCAIDNASPTHGLRPWESIPEGWHDKPGHWQTTYRFTGPNSLGRFFDAGAIQSWAVQDGSYVKYLDDMRDPKRLSKLFADHADGSQGWSPFVGTTDSFFASHFYANKGDLLWVIRSDYGDSFINPHNYARPSTMQGEWERLFLHSIPQDKVQMIYRNRGNTGSGLEYELIYNRDSVTGSLSAISSDRPKIMMLRNDARGRSPPWNGRSPCRPLPEPKVNRSVSRTLQAIF